MVSLTSPLSFWGLSNNLTAVLGITKNDTLHFAPRGIRINAICPGWVRTPMTLAADAARPGFLEAQGHRSPIGRVGHPEEIADCLVFLGSKMSSYMHGVGMVVDGGISVGLGKAETLNEQGGMDK